MSHSKMTKRGYSLYIDKWNPSAKKYINTCALCGYRGYNPIIEDEGFIREFNDIGDLEYMAVYSELKKTLKALPLDSMGRCGVCAAKQM